jgi:hypothetical protein
MSRARDIDFLVGPLGGGATFYPYQISLGLTLRWWPCLFAPTIRLHIGPFKVWAYLRFKRI